MIHKYFLWTVFFKPTSHATFGLVRFMFEKHCPLEIFVSKVTHEPVVFIIYKKMLAPKFVNEQQLKIQVSDRGALKMIRSFTYS